MIEVKNLTKRYGNHTAVSDLSFTIQKGQIYGFLGPNGAGKSTTMNIMTGCLAASSGDVDYYRYARIQGSDMVYLIEPDLYSTVSHTSYHSLLPTINETDETEATTSDSQ